MSFKEAITTTTGLGYFEGQIPVNYQYSCGVAGELFFRTLMEKGDFIASKCAECGTKAVYPLIYCENCFSEIKEYESIGLEGELDTWTACTMDFQGKHHDALHYIGLVRFPGVQGGIIHRLDIRPEELALGMKVKAKLKAQKDRQGGIDDIVAFVKA
jgi:uncharacterized OB-fold protein